MALTDLLHGVDTTQALLALTPLILGLFTAYLFTNRSIPGKTPPLAKDDWPLFGSFRFWTQRWDFFREAAAHSSTGHFSFHVGSHPVVGVTGDEARKVMLESKDLDLNAGYAALFAGAPKPPNLTREESEQAGNRFSKGLVQMLKRENFVKGLDLLLSDTKTRLDELANDPSGFTDPFESIYGIVYQLTMRTVACNEIANDRVLLEKTLNLFEQLDAALSPELIIFPWLPSPAKLKRLWGGTQLYMIFKKIIDNRAKTGHREEDPLQFLIDRGDNTREVVSFVLGALFAGQLNSGINAAWVLVYLANDPYWREKVWEEVKNVAEKYDVDTSKSLAERLSSVPLDAWENELPTVDYCLRDSIRLQATGAIFRQNIGNKSVKMPGNTEIPPGAFAAYHIGDIHLDPEVYPDPHKWDPSRHLPGKAEDQTKKLAFIGWGAGRHPCLGMRFAKLEQNIILAFFLAYFDFELCDKNGKPGAKPEDTDPNGHSAGKPKERVFLKYKVRG